MNVLDLGFSGNGGEVVLKVIFIPRFSWVGLVVVSSLMMLFILVVEFEFCELTKLHCTKTKIYYRIHFCGNRM